MNLSYILDHTQINILNVRKGENFMSVGEALKDIRKEKGWSQSYVANQIPIDRAAISRAESGSEPLSEHHDASLSRMNWKLALKIIDERSNGFVSNILKNMPNIDLHPSAVKESLQKELDELDRALEETLMAKHISYEKRKASAERLWKETKDVQSYATLMLGVLEEEFELDRDRLNKSHEQEVKSGKR